MKSEYFPPALGRGEYHCPHCNVFAKQNYAHLLVISQFPWSSVVDSRSKFTEPLPKEWIVTKCEHCGEIALWLDESMIYPKKLLVSPPNGDLADDIPGGHPKSPARGHLKFPHP
jgi:hypothetical protein